MTCNPGRDCANGVEPVECCKPELCNKKPKCLDDVCTECIFVNNVWDARIFKDQDCDINVEDFTLDFEFDGIIQDSLELTCEILTQEFSPQYFVINGKSLDVDDLDTVAGPGGAQYVIPDDCVDTTECTELGKGTKVKFCNVTIGVIDTILTLTGMVEVGGIPTPFTATFREDETVFLCAEFNDFCWPPRGLYNASIAEQCKTTCLTKILDSEQTMNNIITLTFLFVFCTTCENKVIKPCEICALTTGSCDIKEEDFGFYKENDFPDINTDCKSCTEEKKR